MKEHQYLGLISHVYMAAAIVATEPVPEWTLLGLAVLAAVLSWVKYTKEPV